MKTAADAPESMERMKALDLASMAPPKAVSKTLRKTGNVDQYILKSIVYINAKC